MVNGSAGPTAELHQGDPFQQDLFQEDQPKELREEEAAAVFSGQKEHSDQKEKGVNESHGDGEKEEESSTTPEEQKLKPDALDDLYTSLACSEMYNNVSVLTMPQENIVKVINKLSLVIIHFYWCQEATIQSTTSLSTKLVQSCFFLCFSTHQSCKTYRLYLCLITETSKKQLL